MPQPIKPRNAKKSFDIDWNMRELFSDSALTDFISEIEYKKSLADENEDF